MKTIAERINERTIVQGDCLVWVGAVGGTGYGQMKADGRVQSVHRLVFEAEHGEIPTGAVVDHACRNRVCVRRDHLQAVTQKQNLENQSASGYGVSGQRGVYFDRRTSRWRAGVQHNGRKYWAGRHSTIEEAASAVVALRNRLFTNNLDDH